MVKICLCSNSKIVYSLPLSEYHVILQWRSDSSNQWNNGGHYGGQGYGGYANAAPQNPDMSMHAAAAVNGSS